VSKTEWVKNPLAANIITGLTTCEQEQLVDKSRDGYLKDVFDADKLTQFWMPVKNYYTSLSDKAIKVLLPFVTTHLCETGFSAVAVMKTRHRSLLIIQRELRLTISSMTPWIGKLCAEKHAHPSH
jgi:hypothetical protein